MPTAGARVTPAAVHKLFTIVFAKTIDKAGKKWYNIVTKGKRGNDYGKVPYG